MKIRKKPDTFKYATLEEKANMIIAFEAVRKYSENIKHVSYVIY